MKKLALLLLFVGTPAFAITRTEVLTSAKSYSLHPWTAKTANMTASCSSTYKSAFTPGDYLGLPYGWGGYMTVDQFDADITSGLGAGAQPSDGVLACIAGVDCSGFVSSIWRAGHFTTSSLDQISAVIAQSDLLTGDAINKAGEHVVMFYKLFANGEPDLYEAGGYNVHEYPFGGWSYVMGFTPRRYNSIEGTSADEPVGTVADPIAITSFPYADDRNTASSPSKVFDRCILAPSTNESGPEYVYQATFAQPGMLTVSVTDDAGTDMDVHLYSSFNSNDCIARDDKTFTTPVDCGTYYVVVDTFVNGSGVAQVGNYHLSVTFAPGGTCGAGPHVYATPGKPGDVCAYPGHDGLGFCNPTLGADTCVYSTQGSGSSFCSRPCTTIADCGAYPGGCCSDLGMGDLYCMPTDWCGGSASTAPKPPPMDVGADGGTSDDGGTTMTPTQDGTDGGDAAPASSGHGCAMTQTPVSGHALFAMILLAFVFVLRRRAFRA